MRYIPPIKYKRKGEAVHARDIGSILLNLNDGWSYSMACSRLGISYHYGLFLRRTYPEFGDLVNEVIASRRIVGFS